MTRKAIIAAKNKAKRDAQRERKRVQAARRKERERARKQAQKEATRARKAAAREKKATHVKRALSAYMFFAQEVRAEVKERYPNASFGEARPEHWVLALLRDFIKKTG